MSMSIYETLRWVSLALASSATSAKPSQSVQHRTIFPLLDHLPTPRYTIILLLQISGGFPVEFLINLPLRGK